MGKIINIYYVKKYVEKFGYECLSTEYINSHSKLKFICDKGHKYEADWCHFQRGQRCPKCAIIDINKINKYADSIKCICLSPIYINNKQKLLFKCNNNHKFSLSWEWLRQINECPICKQFRLRPYRNKEWLYNKYITERKSSKEIGKLCNVGHRLILSWLYRFKIPTRSKSISTSLGQYKDHSIFDLKVNKNEKVCLRCKKIKNKSEFRKCSKNKDGLQIYCKKCANSFLPKENGWRKYTKNEIKTVELYRDKIKRLTNYNYTKYFDIINPNKIDRSDKVHSLDHIYSVQDGFDNNISIEVISSPINLKMVTIEENSRKGRKSNMSLDTLYFLYNQFIKEG